MTREKTICHLKVAIISKYLALYILLFHGKIQSNMPLFLSKLWYKLKTRPSWQYGVVFILWVILLTSISWYPAFGDPDGYYHAKMGEIMSQQLVYKTFPWMQLSILKDNFVDHHFLYHILLIPFCWLFTPLWGLKIATILIGAVFLTLFYRFFKVNHFSWPWLYPILLLSGTLFTFRLVLGKANGLAFIFVILLLEQIIKRQNKLLALTSFLFTLSYGGWPLGLFFALIYVFSDSVNVLIQTKKIKLAIFNIWSAVNRKLLFSIGLGNLAGIIINPYFPQNIKFYWVQFVEIGIVNYQKFLNVGREWLPADPVNILNTALIILSAWTLAWVLFVINRKQLTVNQIFFGLLSFTFLCLTLKSLRYVEYFIPLAVIFIAYIFTLKKDSIINIVQQLNELKTRILYLISYIIIVALVGVHLILNFSAIVVYLRNIPFNYLEAGMQYVHDKIPAGTVIAHASWSNWPNMFYHDDTHLYLNGLDPTFSYKFNPEIHKAWDKINNSEINNPLNTVEFFQEILKTDYVFVPRANDRFLQNLQSNQYFQAIYQDDHVVIFKLL